MVLAHLGRRFFYPWLKWRLGTTDAGTFFANIDRLRSWRLRVERDTGNLDTLRAYLETGCPLIVPVAAEILPHWIRRAGGEDERYANNHVVVVVGLDEQNVYVNDPDFAEAPQMVEIDWFLAAWGFQDYQYAVLRRR